MAEGICKHQPLNAFLHVFLRLYSVAVFDGGCVNASSLQVVGRVEDLDKHEVPESFKRCTLQWEECWSICLLDTVYGSILKTYLGQVH